MLPGGIKPAGPIPLTPPQTGWVRGWGFRTRAGRIMARPEGQSTGYASHCAVFKARFRQGVFLYAALAQHAHNIHSNGNLGLP